MQPILVVLGTRPEAIKLVPIIVACARSGVEVVVCSTGQHAHLLRDIFELFGIVPDVDLALMRHQQELSYVATAALEGVTRVIKSTQPRMVIVQGDTTTAMAASVAAFYARVPLVHVEAGLRTHNMYAPFPEEFNRCVSDLVATYRCAPTHRAAHNMLKEGMDPKTIYVTGNTVVDALRMVRHKIATGSAGISTTVADAIEQIRARNLRSILFTLHRRELGVAGIDALLGAVRQAIVAHEDLAVVYPYHPNPLIRDAIARVQLAHHPRVFVMPPLAYQDFVYVMSRVDGVFTDSGGVQEEAISINKPTYVVRNETERMEGVEAGAAQLIGTDPQSLFRALSIFCENPVPLVDGQQVYGDGHAAERIMAIVQGTFPSLHEMMAAGTDAGVGPSSSIISPHMHIQSGASI